MTTPRHIVHIMASVGAGGVQKLVLGMAASPALSGYRHSALCLKDDGGDLRSEYDAAGVNVELCSAAWPPRLPIASYRATRWVQARTSFSFPWRLALALRRMKADLVHSHVSRRVDHQLQGVLSLARLPLVWTLHALYDLHGPHRRHWERALALARNPRCQMTVDSAPVREHLERNQFQLPSNVPVVHAGADVERFIRATKPDGWRAQHGIPATSIVFGTAGRLVDIKGHDILIDATQILLRSVPDAHVVIAGTGPAEPALRAQLERLGLQHNVHLLGFTRDVASLLKALDVFVLPSRSEGFPLAMIEALASGLACIGADVGGVAHMLGERGGLVVPPEKSEALAAAMQKMIDRTLRATFEHSAVEIARRYSVAACSEELATIYARLLA